MFNNKEFIEYLDERFQKIGISWIVHEWTYYGMSYGLDLIHINGEFILRQLVDSGYNRGDVIASNIKDIYRIVNYLQPTKKDYKFDRKD